MNPVTIGKERYRRKVIETIIEDDERSLRPTVWRVLECGHHIAEPKNNAFQKWPNHLTPKPARSRICEQCEIATWRNRFGG